MSDEKETASRRLAGGCYCGAVAYEVVDDFKYALNCHCADCRRATGSAFKPFGGIARSRLQILKGSEKLMIFGDPTANHDVHCGTCGSLLYSVVGADWVHVAFGTLVEAPTTRPSAHIFVADKAPWYEIHDSLPQYPGHRP